MAKTVTIDLDEPLLGHGDPVRRVVLREPSFSDYLQLGDINTLFKTPEDVIFAHEKSDVIQSYIQRCLVEPKDYMVLEQGGLKLAKALKGAVLDFFRAETSATEPSKT